jgi:oxygen-independent coproporphyrinogen-3 oxidase
MNHSFDEKFSNLLKKYNVPGPRYTSYPTVPYWDTTPSEKQWKDAVFESLEKNLNTGAALYIHIPFCESLCTYCGCNNRITRNHEVSKDYIPALHKEFLLLTQNKKLRLSELHLGGGTPTFLSPNELIELLKPILKQCDLTSDFEFSLEADPRVTSFEHLKVLRDLGFKRLSLGIQDFDPTVQKAVNRIQSVEQVEQLTYQARELGFNSINYDLIYGLPFQTLKSIENTFKAVARLKPDRIAFYAYAHVPWIKPGHRKFTEEDLPNADSKRALYELGRMILESENYFEIGMDHFALKTDSLYQATLSKTLHRNFMGYTSRFVAPLIGLGVSAIGDTWNIFAQNEKVLEKYYERLKKNELPILRGHILTDEDMVLRKHILNIMTLFETSWSKNNLHTLFLEKTLEKLEEFKSDDLIEVTIDDKNQDESKTIIKVKDKGRPFLRNISMAFDARLFRNAPSTQIFSKTI